jgi:hypothetical protein
LRPWALASNSEPVLQTTGASWGRPRGSLAIVRCQSRQFLLRPVPCVKRGSSLYSCGFVEAQEQGPTKVLTVTEDLLRYFGVASLDELRAQLCPVPRGMGSQAGNRGSPGA